MCDAVRVPVASTLHSQRIDPDEPARPNIDTLRSLSSTGESHRVSSDAHATEGNAALVALSALQPGVQVVLCSGSP